MQKYVFNFQHVTFSNCRLTNGTRWIFSSEEIINFLDIGQTTEQELEAGTNSIATTGGVLNWITSLNRADVGGKTDFLETVNNLQFKQKNTNESVHMLNGKHAHAQLKHYNGNLARSNESVAGECACLHFLNRALSL